MAGKLLILTTSASFARSLFWAPPQGGSILSPSSGMFYGSIHQLMDTGTTSSSGATRSNAVRNSLTCMSLRGYIFLFLLGLFLEKEFLRLVVNLYLSV